MQQMLGLFTSKKPLVRDIVVPASAAAPEAERYALILAVVDYVNDMMESGEFRRWELPAAALQAYHADYYYAQVCNGGHSQFIRNSQMPTAVLNDAEAGLKAMGGKVYLDCLRHMRDWADDNPETANAQDGFGARAPELDALDEKFFAADRDEKTAFYTLATPWMRRQRALKIVPDDRHAIAVDKIKAANPLAAERADIRTVGKVSDQLSNPLLAGLHMAARRADQPHVIKALTNGQFTTIDGEQKILWNVLTDKGLRRGLHLEGNGVLLLDETKTDGGADDQGSRRVGAVAEADIDAAMAHAKRQDTAMAVVAMLRQAGIGNGPDWIAWEQPVEDAGMGRDTSLYRLGLTEEHEAFLLIGDAGALIGDHTLSQPVARIARNDIASARVAMEARINADGEAMEKSFGRKTKRIRRAAPLKAARPAEPEAPVRSGQEDADIGLLGHYSEDDLRMIDDDIIDLHESLTNRFHVGASLCLMARRLPASLLEVGGVVEEWVINEEPCDRIEIQTTRGPMTASEISTGVSLHTTSDGGPKDTLVELAPGEKVDDAAAAAHRYPVALGLFVLLDQADLTGRFLTACHYQTGGKGLKEALYANVRVKRAVEAAVAAQPEAGKQRRSQDPSEHYLLTFEDTDQMAIAHFGQERAMLLPFSDQANGLIPNIPIIAMQDLLEEEKVLLARLKQ